MGLDIIAYRKLRKVRLAKEEDTTEDDDKLIESGLVRFYDNPGFPGRIAGVATHTWYGYEDSFGFHAGSYTGYNAWREWLACLPSHAGGDPFEELVNFSDCEGTIGPSVSAKLARSFALLDDTARRSGNIRYYALYQCWRKAFETAADDGAVSFQ